VEIAAVPTVGHGGYALKLVRARRSDRFMASWKSWRLGRASAARIVACGDPHGR